MKKLLALMLLATFSLANASWRLATVHSKDVPVGYIYYTGAVGTATNSTKEKLETRLQFICSLRGGEPIVSIFWEKAINSNSEVEVSFIPDNSPVMITSWTNDGELVYKTTANSPGIINAVKTSRIIKFRMQGNNTSYSTAFNVAGVDFTEFNAKCGTQL